MIIIIIIRLMINIDPVSLTPWSQFRISVTFFCIYYTELFRIANVHLWLGGNFSLPNINLKEECTTPHASNSTQCNQLLTIMRDSFLDQVVSKPTRITKTTSSTLDLFFASNQTIINKVEVDPGISDYKAVFIESSQNPLNVKILARKVYQYRKGDYEGMRAEILPFQTEFESQADTIDVEQLCTLFKNKLHSLMNKYTLRDVSYNARWFWTTIRYGPMTTAYLCWTTSNGF